MGLGDKFKDLAKQAQDTVVEHREQIHEAVDAASAVADRRTGGKYSTRIAKLNQKAAEAVDKVTSNDEAGAPPNRAAGTSA